MASVDCLFQGWTFTCLYGIIITKAKDFHRSGKLSLYKERLSQSRSMAGAGLPLGISLGEDRKHYAVSLIDTAEDIAERCHED